MIDLSERKKYTFRMLNDLCIQTIIKIRKLSKFLDKYSKYLDNKYKVTLPQLLCLYEIHAHNSITLSELTRKLNMNNSAMTGIVDRLETKCLLQRVRKGNDRRTVYIEFTESGRDYANQLLRVLENDCVFDTSQITERQLLEISESLDKITNSLDPEVKKIDLNS